MRPWIAFALARCATADKSSLSLLAIVRVSNDDASQERGRFQRHRVANRDLAALDHLGIDAAFVVAEAAHQRVRDFHVAYREIGIDVHGGAAGDALHDLQPAPPTLSVSPTRLASCQAGQPRT